MKAGFISLGCAKNRVDTEVMLGMLTEQGFEIIQDASDAELLVVNTCSFIDTAKEESISTILQMSEYKKIGKCRVMVVAGCLGQRYGDQLMSEIPEIDAIVGTNDWDKIKDVVNKAIKGIKTVAVDGKEKIYDGKTNRVITTPEYSVYIKIAEGCDNCCSYCVIPALRGKFRSRTIDSIVEEAKRLVNCGAKEINLIAQDTTCYGKDLYGAPSLSCLLRELTKIENLKWIRLLYCYPHYFSDELIEMIANEPKVIPYVDLPLQHIHDDILRAMNRRDTEKDIRLLLNKIRATIPDVAIRTTFIVGFPGETEEHFQFLKQFMVEQKFDHVGVFPYSKESDTVAAVMDGQVDEQVKEERYHELMAIQAAISEETNRLIEGKELEVMLEGKGEGEAPVLFGRSYREAPDVDGRVYIEQNINADIGDIVNVKIVQGFAYDLVAEPVLSDERDEADESVLPNILGQVVGDKLRRRNMTIAFAESCTGGLISAEITKHAGCSDYFVGSVVCYNNRIKTDVLGINAEILEEHGAVSVETARYMAKNIRMNFAVDIGLSVTGIAGPGGATEDKKIGLVFIGIDGPNGTEVFRFEFSGQRDEIREKTVQAALSKLNEYIYNIEED